MSGIRQDRSLRYPAGNEFPSSGACAFKSSAPAWGKEVGMSRPAGRHAPLFVFVLASLAIPPAAMGLPATVRRFVDNLDERCYQILGQQPPLNLPLNLTFLDPVLVKKGLKPGNVVLQAP